MKIKIITSDSKDKITLTPKELQEIVDEAYEEGRKDGLKITSEKEIQTIPSYPYPNSPYPGDVISVYAAPPIDWKGYKTTISSTDIKTLADEA